MNTRQMNPRQGGSHLNLFRLGLGLAALYWLLESLLHAYLFDTAPLSETLLGMHCPNEIWMRLLIMALLVGGLGWLAEGMMRRERRSRQREQKINRQLQFLSDVNQHVQRHLDGQEMLEAACRSAVQIGGFRFAWIGMKQDDGLRLAAWSAADAAIGKEVEKLQAPGALLDCLGCQSVLQKDVSEICELESREDCTAPWLEPFLEQGCRHAIAMPLRIDGRTAGVFWVYAGEEGEISPGEQALLDEVADDVSVALTHIAQQEERRQRDAELRQRIDELERFQKATVQREFRIKELRDEVARLKGGEGREQEDGNEAD